MNGRRSRSFSAPALRINSGSYTRARSRQTAVDYEQGKDRIAHWIGAWSSEEVGHRGFQLPGKVHVLAVRVLPIASANDMEIP